MNIIAFARKYILALCFLSVLCFSTHAQNASVYFQIVDQDIGQLTPARLTVLKKGKPYPQEVPSQLHLATRENTIYTASGTGSFDIAPGKYTFWFGKGMEYSLDIKKLEIKADSTYFLTAKLKKELNTEGFVSGDMHLHTYTNSGHGDANLIERVISCTAEGLEWAVATDHNFITDYSPYMEQAGLKGLMSTSVGNEVSTSVGHYNTYPIPADGEPINSKPTDLKLLFDSIRLDAGQEVIIQVNHPRWIASDYFNTKGLDIYFGTAKHPEWSWDFDAIEVLNENYQLGWKTAPDNLQSVKRDWFNLLNHNRRVTGLGNSDSHDVVKAIAGYPRNYIMSSTDIPAEIDEREIAANVKAQRVSVASGIFTKIMVDGKSAMGETFMGGENGLELQLQVQAVSWIDCTKAELLENGQVIKRFDLKKGKNPLRLDTTVVIHPEMDSWYVLIASGEKPMYPMVGTLKRPVYPLGFTNPVWVDQNADGNFQSYFDYAKSIIGRLEKEGRWRKRKNQSATKSFELYLQKHPAIAPYLFYHLFEMEHHIVLDLCRRHFKKAGTEQKRMLMRELAKSDINGAETMLKSFRKERLTPLEEVVLSSYIHFPIRRNRVEDFKARQTDQLDEQLNYLETKLTYLHSGAIEQQMELGFNRGKSLKCLWEYAKADKNGFFHFTAKPVGQYLLKSNWKMRKDTSLYFYLHSNQSSYLVVNGEEIKALPRTDNVEVSKKLIEVPLAKGNNEIILRIPALSKSSFCFYQAGETMLLDPTKKFKTIEHKALDKSVKYQNEYHHKYHGFGTALTDGFRGETGYGDQLWQGWEGENAHFIIDLGKEMTIEEIKLGVLANQGAWIFFPKKVTFLANFGNKDWGTVFEQELDPFAKLPAPKIMDIGGKIKPVKTRYIQVIAEKIEGIPDWHNAKGENAWIFLDEVIVR